MSAMAGLGAATTSLVGATPLAEAAVYFNRSGAASTADIYAYGNNPYGTKFPQDCANYVSQMWHWGGQVAQNGSWLPFSLAWVNADAFTNYHINDHYQSGQHFATGLTPGANQWATANTSAWMGDAIAYAYNDGVGWQHLAIHTYNTWVGVDDDIYDGLDMQMEYNKYVDVINQHTTDRKGVPWNGAYWANVAAGQPTSDWYVKVVHVNA